MKYLLMMLLVVSTSAMATGYYGDDNYNKNYNTNKAYGGHGGQGGHGYGGHGYGGHAKGGNAKATGVGIGVGKSYSDSTAKSTSKSNASVHSANISGSASKVSNSGNSKSGSISGAKNEGNNTNIEHTEVHPDDIEIRQLGTLVSQPNNNTSSCIKVWGIASGNKDVQGILGIPQRDMQCDLDAAAKDAFAQGNYLMGWSLKCNMKSIQKIYRKTYRRNDDGSFNVTMNRTPPERHAACMDTARKYAPVKPDFSLREAFNSLPAEEKTKLFKEMLSNSEK